MSTRISAIVTASSTERVLRFTRTERAAHWVQAVTFLTLMATGLAISLVQIEALIGHRSLLREVHLAAAFFFVFGPTLVSLAGNRVAVAADVRDVDEWSADDARWLLHPQLEPTDGTPPSGKFNAGQKLNAIFTLYATFAFGLTGLILWQNRRFPIAVVAQANTIHTYLAYLALLVFFGHLYLAAIHPATRHALHGMVSGSVNRDWAARHHPRWPAGLSEPPLDPRSLLRPAVLLVLGLEVALLMVRTLFEVLGANDTDAVTGLIYTLSSLPATISHHVTGAGALDVAALLWAGLLAVVWLAVNRRGVVTHQRLPVEA
jgi:formate dehydrogenase subunit gamma